jgi:glycosyltransferase involved in cell wall biosynthesis
MIYHHPLPLPQQGLSGSMVRICKMIEAFRNIGYTVHEVHGYARERKEAIKKIKASARGGQKFDFLYSESSTAPTLLAKRNIGKPFLEIDLFTWCRRNVIPVGLFYRDIHWRFDQYKTVARLPRRAIAILLYWYDWLQYQSLVNYLFLPSLEMATFLPFGWRRDWIHALPPGCDIKDKSNNLCSMKGGGGLTLLYVGGMKPPLYDLTPLFESINISNVVSLILCCRQNEWQEVSDFYGYISHEKVKIVHVNSHQLAPYYFSADAFLLAWEQHPYLSFAMPVKLFESIGYGLPLISMTGTRAASFITEKKIGWVVMNTEELVSLFEHLVRHPEEVIQKKKNVESMREEHTWEMRAKQVAAILSEK